MKEPSVLDYVKSILMPWKGERIILPQPGEPAVFPEDRKQLNEAGDQVATADASIYAPVRSRENIRPRFLYRTYLAVVLAILAQFNLDTQAPHVIPAVASYFLAGIFLIWALIVKEWQVLEIGEDAGVQMPLNIRLGALGFSIPLFVIAYISFANNKFSIYNILIGVLLVAYMVYVFFVTQPTQGEALQFQPPKYRGLLKPFWTDWDSRIQFTPWHLAIVTAFIFVLFFRFYRLDSVPNEMISDHAEKLLDVGDVLAGQTSIFFPRNTGREAFQFYVTALISQLFGTGISFISLKIGTATAGVVTLIFVYLLGKEVANRRVGLLAMILTGVAYWPNVISRIGLRFALYPLFVAPL
ncbi:MAG: hypothetical protein Q7U74_03905, partial [Saprospiraceae bacterium]|nr:hypothetical protein [Saprospiraceae bacterium]